MSARIFISRDSGALCVGAEEVAHGFRKAFEKRGPRCRDRPHRLARHVLAGAAGRSRDRQGPGRLRAGQGERYRCAARCRHARRQAAQSRHRRRRRLSLARESDAAHLQELRHHRSAQPRGLQSAWRLSGPRQGARRRAEGDRRGGHHLRLARPRRRGLPHRHQMAHGGRHPAPAEIHRLQRRRRRFRHLRRPHDHGGRSLRADRRHDHCRDRGGRHLRLHLYPLRISRCHRGDGDRRARSAQRRHAGTAHRRLGVRFRHGSAGPAPGLMSAARKPRCSRAWKASAARSGPSHRCPPISACSASRPSSTMCCRLPPCRSS